MAELQAVILLVLFVSFAVRALQARNLPRVGGKIGWQRADLPAPPFPDGIAWSYVRADTLFAAKPDGAAYSNFQAFLRGGTVKHPALINVFRMAGCRTEIEIPAQTPDYDRIDIAEAVAMLRELPDVRLVRRLHVSDAPAFHDPWVRQVAGRQYFLLGTANRSGLIGIYRPTRRFRDRLRITLLHEWLHLLAYQSPRQVRRFKRVNAIEQLPPAVLKPVFLGDRQTSLYEAWCELGERLFGFDETDARQAALAAPAHAIILWRSVEKSLKATPPALRSTRFDELAARGEFMNRDVAAAARTARARRWWRF